MSSLIRFFAKSSFVSKKVDIPPVIIVFILTVVTVGYSDSKGISIEFSGSSIIKFWSNWSFFPLYRFFSSLFRNNLVVNFYFLRSWLNYTKSSLRPSTSSIINFGGSFESKSLYWEPIIVFELCDFVVSSFFYMNSPLK